MRWPISPLLLVYATLGASLGCYASDDVSADERKGAVVAAVSRAAALGPELQLAQVTAVEPTVSGRVQAVADLGERVVLFGDRGAVAIAGGNVTASASDVVAWRSAAVVPAADGTGRWAVAASEDGRLLRLHDQSRVEDVRSRYGVESTEHVKAVVSMTATTFAVVLERSSVVVDIATKKTTRFDVAWDSAAASTTRIAGVGPDTVSVFDITTKTLTASTVRGAKSVAFDDRGRMLVLAEHTIVRESGASFETVVVRDDVALDGLTSAGARVWFAAGAEIWALEHDTARRAPTVVASPGHRIAAGADGDVWLVGEQPVRFRIEASPEEAAWLATIGPIQDRVCKECHAPGASASLDLATFAAWAARRDLIRDRVVVARTMPPPPRSLSAAELETIRGFVQKP